MDIDFRPKQLTEDLDSIFTSLQGDADWKAREYAVSLISPIPPGSVIHDSACGSGIVFKTIMLASGPTAPPPDLRIYASDHSGRVVQELRLLVAERGWPVTVANMKSQRLRFADAFFTHSFLCFASHVLLGYGGAPEIYRTLRSDGVALVVEWLSRPFANAVRSVHQAMRNDPEDDNLPIMCWELSGREDHLRKALIDGGFSEEDVQVERTSIQVDIEDPARWAQLAWSYLGAPACGFTQRDEADWEKNVEMLLQELRDGNGTVMRDDGTIALEIILLIVTATKT